MTPEAQLKAALKGLPNVSYYRRYNEAAIKGRGSFTPEFVLLHHTGGTNSRSTLTSKAPYAPVPGANFLVARDGGIWVISQFISYHAGAGGPRWGVAAGMMNHYAWGIEIEDPGETQTMTAAQISAASALSARLLKAAGQPISHLVQHKAWSSTGKVDTRYTDAFWRAHATAALTVEPAVTVKSTLFGGVKILADDKHPTTKLHDFPVKAGTWTTFATDWIEAKANVEYLLTVQSRAAAEQRLQTRVVRIGWGAEATSASKLDGTFYEDVAAQSYESSHSFSHPIRGGGPIAFQVLAHNDLPVPTLIGKVTPLLRAS